MQFPGSSHFPLCNSPEAPETVAQNARRVTWAASNDQDDRDNGLTVQW